VDTEHGFVGKLKAIWPRFQRVFRARMQGRIGGKRGARTEPKNAGSENGRDFVEALVGGHGGGIVVRSHGTSRWKRPQRPSPGDGPAVWQEEFVYL
jgi:hypothetical protein